MNRRKAKILFMSLCLMICMVLFVSNNTNAASKKPTKMTLNVSKKTVDVGGTYQIKVKSVSPSKASKSVAYKSSNTKIATISSKGIVKGKKEGTAKITVQSKKNKKLKKTVAITVKRLKPYSLTLNKTKLNMNVTNFSMMFSGCNNLTTLNLSSFNTSKVCDMDWMFRDCTKLKTITVSNKWMNIMVRRSRQSGVARATYPD